MARKIKPATSKDVWDVRSALVVMRMARCWLDRADAVQASAKLRRAIKSAEGAVRHIERRARLPGGAYHV